MKPHTTLIFLAAIFLSLSSCDPERKLSEPEKALVGPEWRMKMALIDGQADTTDFTHFRLTFLPRGKWKSIEVDQSERKGSWAYLEADSSLSTVDQVSGFLVEYAVPVLNEQQLRLQFTVSGRAIDWQLEP